MAFGNIQQGRKYLDQGRVLNILSVIGVIILWEMAADVYGTVIIPPPTDVAATWYEMTIDGTIPTALYNSLQHMLVGYMIAIGLAIPLGLVMGRSEIVRWMINPYIDALYATPAVAFIPLVIVWFGLGFQGRVFLVFFFCFFEILMDTYEGVHSISQDLMDVGESFDLSWFHRQRMILLPASLPYIFAGLRLGIGRAVRAMIVAEIFLAIVNLGELLEMAGATLDTSTQLAVIVTITIFGVIAQSTLKAIEHRAIPWHFESGGH